MHVNQVWLSDHASTPPVFFPQNHPRRRSETLAVVSILSCPLYISYDSAIVHVVQVQCGWSLKKNSCRRDSWGKCSKILYCFHKTCRNIRTGGTESSLEVETETSSVRFSKSSIPNWVRLLGVLAAVIAKLLSIMIEKSWSLGVGRPWKLCKYYSHLQNRPKGQSSDQSKFVTLLLILKQVTEWVLLEDIAECMKAVVLGNSQHRCTKHRPCLISLTAFYGKVTGFVDKGRTVNVVYLDFGRLSTESFTVSLYPS